MANIMQVKKNNKHRSNKDIYISTCMQFGRFKKKFKKPE